MIFPLGRPFAPPSDRLGHEVARLLLAPSATRDRLTAECHLPKTEKESVGAIELALQATLAAEPIEAKIRKAEKAGQFDGNPDANVRDIARVAAQQGVISAAEYEVIKRRNELRDIVVRVDDFPFDLWLSAKQGRHEERSAA